MHGEGYPRPAHGVRFAGSMGMLRKVALATAMVFVVPGAPAPAADMPLPARIERDPAPIAETWTKKSARLDAIAIRISATGAHTHANWVFFRLPFDTSDFDRVRAVVFTPSAASDPDVAALRIGSACLPYARYGPLDTWAEYTVSGIGRTLPFAQHPNPPTDDPTVLGINVPTRVANHVACGLDDGRFSRLDFWRLDVSWEER